MTPRERRAGALGLVGASFSLGFIFGPALGGLLASERVVAAASVLPIPATKYSLPAFGAAVMSLAALTIAAVVLAEPDRLRTRGSRQSLVSQFSTALRDPSLRGLVVAFFLVSVSFAGIQVMFIPFIADATVYGYDASAAGLLLTYVGVLGALNQGLLVGRLSRRIGPRRLAIVGAGLLLVSLAALPFAPELGALLPPTRSTWFTRELVALLIVLGLLSLGNGMLNPSLATLVSTSTGADTQGTAFGVTQGAGSLGRTIGPRSRRRCTPPCTGRRSSLAPPS